MISKKKILNTEVDDIEYSDLISVVSNSLRFGKKTIINYANANTLRLSAKNDQLKLALSHADLVHPDGTGIWLASKLTRRNSLNKRFNFTDYAFRFLDDCIKKGWSVFLLGAREEMLLKAVSRLRKNYPGLNIAGHINGYEGLEDGRITGLINSAKPDIIWVGTGTPNQELWIAENAAFLNASVIQSVGDLITYLAGKKARGPLFIRKMGLEWLARLIRHPVRYFDRYVIGIPRFIYLVIKTRDK